MYDSNKVNALARALRSQIVSGGNSLSYSKNVYGETSLPAEIIEKTISGTWSIDDPTIRSTSVGFIDLVQRHSILGQISAISGFQKIPVGIETLVQDNVLNATWVGEAGEIPTASSEFSIKKTESKKIATIFPMTKELFSKSGLDFEASVNRALISAVANLETLAFISTSIGSDETPAGILNGVSPIPSTSDVKEDIQNLINGFNGDLSKAVFVTSPRNGVALFNAGYDSTGANGGSVAGIDHVTNNVVPDDLVVLIDPSRILLSDQGVQLDASEASTLNLGDNVIVSLYQNNLVAIRIIRHLDFLKADDNAVAFLNNVNWS